MYHLAVLQTVFFFNQLLSQAEKFSLIAKNYKGLLIYCLKRLEKFFIKYFFVKLVKLLQSVMWGEKKNRQPFSPTEPLIPEPLFSTSNSPNL
jgi:hypothetical protein